MSADIETYEGITQQQIIRGENYHDCIAKLRTMYGNNYCAITHRTVKKPGLVSFLRGDHETEMIYGVLENKKNTARPQSSAFMPQGINFALEQQKVLSMAAGAIGTKSPATLPLGAASTLPPPFVKPASALPESKSTEAAVLNEVLKNLSAMSVKIDTISEKIETEDAGGGKLTKSALNSMQALLEKNEFSAKYTEDIKMRLKNALTLIELENEDVVQTKTLQIIYDDIKIADARQPAPVPVLEPGAETVLQPAKSKPHIIVIVGPTGVGKTTTVAKLAAQQSSAGKKVHIITIDGFRIAAKEQIKRYAELIGTKYSTAENAREIRRLFELDEGDVDVMIVDTIGYSPNDAESIETMRSILDIADLEPDVMLAFSAEKKTSDIEHILNTYTIFNYNSIIVTKIDETSHIGNVLSALHYHGKPVSYITAGQKVPRDIKYATPLLFLQKLSDFNSGSF